MSEKLWIKMFILSIILHLSIVSVMSLKIKKPFRKIDSIVTYSLGLVDDIGGPEKIEGSKVEEITKGFSPKVKSSQEKRGKLLPVKKSETRRIEEKSISISRQKKETFEETDAEYLEKRLWEIKTKIASGETEKKANIERETTQAQGFTNIQTNKEGSRTGAFGRHDPIFQAYLMEIWNTVKKAWKMPGVGLQSKGLETIVIVKIRKDGRIIDIEVEKRSGNRIYDESVLRVLRNVEPFPPFPSSLNVDMIEIGFRFLPGEIS